MDRVEFKLKTDQIRTFIEEGEFQKAAELADSINWRKVKQVSGLCLAGEAYEKAQRYEDSKELLLMAYDRTPIGRNIVYKLAIVAVKAGNFQEAEEFYEEFLHIASNDNIRYLLKYQIARGKGEPLSDLIQILEEYKELESSERWSYELASLYHKAGMIDACVNLCDELVLWYGEGKYVEKALELKMLYHPLTEEQERKYKQIRQNREGIVEIESGEELASGEITNETIVIPQVEVKPVTFDTVNLQQELQENMKQIMEATERGVVVDHMEQIKKLVNQIPYLSDTTEMISEEEEEKYGHIETDEEIDGSLRIDFKNLLAEDYDGQISMNVPHSALSEPQINGQMSIEDVLGEWERTKRAAQTALEAANQRKLESAKARALQEAEGIMDRLQDVIPQLNAMIDAQLSQGEQEELFVAEQEELFDTNVEPELESEEDIREEYMEEVPQTQEMLKEIVNGLLQTDLPVEEEPVQTAGLIPDFLSETVAELEMENEVETLAVKTEEQLDELLNQTTKKMDFSQENGYEQEIKEEEEEIPSKNYARFLTPEQKNIFSYFVSVPGMEKQICQAMEEVNRKEDKTSVSGNILIVGERGSGKTQLATNLVKVLQKKSSHVNGKVGKISAAVLNKKDIVDLISRMNGGYLIIEKAGDLSMETATKLSLAMEQDTNRMIVILEDTKAGIRELSQMNPEFYKKFSTKVTIPLFTNDELVNFAKSYALEKDYEIDEMAILALYKRISNIQKVERATTLTEVKEIVDEAIEHANKGGFKRKFVKGFGRKKADDDKELLLEIDFERD